MPAPKSKPSCADVCKAFTDWCKAWSPLLVSIAVLLAAVFFGWTLVDNRIGPPSRSEFRVFVGVAASLATVGAILTTAFFVSRSDLLSTELRKATGEVSRKVKAIDQTLEELSRGDTGGPVEPGPVYLRDPSFAEKFGGKEYQVLTGADTPLWVLAALYADLGDGESQRGWTPQVVLWTMRQTGQGNFAWLVGLQAPVGQLFRVSRGGQGKTGATVTRVDLPPELVAIDERRRADSA